MTPATLLGIRDRLAADPGISAFFAERYPGCAPAYFVGLKPDLEEGTGVPADRFPYIAVSPLAEAKGARPSRERLPKLSVMFGLNEDRVEGDVALASLYLGELSELILAALEAQPLLATPPAVWDGAADLVFDTGANAPYHEAEIILELKVRT